MSKSLTRTSPYDLIVIFPKCKAIQFIRFFCYVAFFGVQEYIHGLKFIRCLLNAAIFFSSKQNRNPFYKMSLHFKITMNVYFESYQYFKKLNKQKISAKVTRYEFYSYSSF